MRSHAEVGVDEEISVDENTEVTSRTDVDGMMASVPVLSADRGS